ncbi:MAG: hypothetical protein V4686_00935 [Patescibacteria group bacterium]
MKCIQVLPILKHTFSEELTYWTPHTFSIGDLIVVTLNKRKIYAIVSSVLSLSEAKEFIKSSDFKIKKIEEYEKIDFFSNEFIKSCIYTSKYFIRSFGEILSEYIPKSVLEELSEQSTPNRLPVSKEKHIPIYVQKEFGEQIQYAEELLKIDTDIVIVVPTDSYKKHISQSLATEKVTIITPIDLYKLDVLKVDVCILAFVGSEYYRHLRKKFDVRVTVRHYCELRNVQLVEMDSVLPLYTHVEIQDITSPFSNTPQIYVVDQSVSGGAKVSKKNVVPKPEDEADIRVIMEQQIDVVSHKKLKLLSPELYSLIAHAEKTKDDVFIYTTRKGLSTSVTCSDCGHVLACTICKKPFSLKDVKGARTFVCPQGHTPPPTDTPCPICGNPHLQLLGSATDALREELEGIIAMPVVIVDGDHMTQAGARTIFKKRKDKDHVPTIYIGTELALHQGVQEKFTYTGIASLETLLALPTRIAELEAIRVIEAMREKTLHTLVIQTRHIEHVVWKSVQEKTWSTLLMQIRNDTKTLGLPPFKTHVQIQISNKKDYATVRTFLQKYMHVDATDNTLHIHTSDWPLDPLYRYLKSVPEYIHIEVDSPSLM